MRIVRVEAVPIRISRYADAAIPSGGLTTSLVAIVADLVSEGRPIIGYGYDSVGRFAQVA